MLQDLFPPCLSQYTKSSGIFASHHNKLSLVNQLLLKHSPYQEYFSPFYPRLLMYYSSINILQLKYAKTIIHEATLILIAIDREDARKCRQDLSGESYQYR